MRFVQQPPVILLVKRLRRRYFGKRFSFVHVQALSLLVFSAGALVGLTLLVNEHLIPRIFASDTSYTWNFASTGDYISSSATAVEVAANTARLKVLNYVSDAQTAILLHFDESTGDPADSSSYASSTTGSNVSYTTGNLNNAGSFDGTTTQLQVADSVANSLTSAHTLEAWTKFSDAFTSSSHQQRQGVIDKGTYQLYYDNETGKLVYELQNAAATTWSQVGGNELNNSWDIDGQLMINDATNDGTNVYVGLGNSVGDGEVWRWNGSVWAKIGGDGINDSWANVTFENVTSLHWDGTYVYAGLGSTAGDAEVWRWNPSTSTWDKIGGDALNASWQVNMFEAVLTMTSTNGVLYAGLGNSANDAEVWSWNGTSWIKIGGDSLNSGWTTNFDVVWKLESDAQHVYAGLGLHTGEAEVWRWSIADNAWTRIGGDGINSSWANSTYEYVLSLDLLGGTLYAGLGTGTNDAEVWSWSGSAWTKVGGDSINSGWTTNYESVQSLDNDGQYLYAGLGSSGGDQELWRLDVDTTTWTKIAGDGLNSSFTGTAHTHVDALTIMNGDIFAGVSSNNAAYTGQLWRLNSGTWSQIGGDSVNTSWGFRGLQTVEVLHAADDKLYAGTGLSTAGNAMVWEFDGTNWQIIGGQANRGSWAINTYETVTSMISHQGELYVGLGYTANDAEVWKYDGSTWTQMGGDTLFSSWPAGYEEVNALASLDGYLYAGLGNSGGDAEVWRWNGTAWNKIGGDSINTGWTTNYDRVRSLVVYRGELYAGLGSSAGEAEVWRWSGTAWNKVGGDTIASSWDSVNYEQVDALIPYEDKLYAGLGTTTGDAEVWEYDGSSWTKIGGDDLNNGWIDGTYERIRTLVVYNGALFAGLGNGTGEGEVWRYRDATWTKVAGNSINSSWGNTIEEVTAFSPYRGKLYAGLGNTQNVDAQVWVYGNNGYLESSTTNFSTDWYHIAATYDGSSMKLYINGVLDAQTSVAMTMPDTTNPVLIGSTYGGREYGKPQGRFDGLIDEVRISSVVRDSFTATPFSQNVQTIQPAAAVYTSGIHYFDAFTTSENTMGGTINYRLSDDGGTSWKYYNSGWVVSSTLSDANTVAVIHANIDTFPVTEEGILWQAVLSGDGDQQVTLNEVAIGGIADTTAPSNPDTLTALSASGGSSITTDTWYGGAAPYFSWTGATDGGSGVAGYYVYFGTDETADPATAGTFQTGSSYVASGLTTGQTYYLRIKSKDNAQNSAGTVWAAFTYKYDGSAPSNPLVVSVSPAGYAAENSFTFSWPITGPNAASDVGSGIAGYQYKTGTPSGTLADWSSPITTNSVNIPSAAYQEGENVFYVRTIDVAGNVNASSVTANYYFAGEGPSAPQFLAATPNANTINSFAFSWSPPASHSGDEDDLTYCYTVNSLPNADNCTFTSPGATSLSASSFATQVGLNTFYLVAKNPDDSGGAINYGVYASATFTANTAAPGIPLNIDVADISIKSSELWRITVSWNSPTDVGSGVSSYQIHRSLDGVTFAALATTTGTAYVDTNLDQVLHYYKVRACDNVNNCGAFSEVVELLPTGKFTEPANLVDGPTVSAITTRQATVSWSTDRLSDSKVAFGTSSGSYFAEEPSNATQKIQHQLALKNLSPGTTYFYKAKWTDEDGNTGQSAEKSFITAPAPVVVDPQVGAIGLDSAAINFTVSGASKVKIYYGETSAFSGVQEVSTAVSESSYTAILEDLSDGTKYFYKINAIDTEGAEYEGNVLTFETLPRPKIDTIRVEQVKGTAQPTIVVTWKTNTPTSSIVTYYPEGRPGEAKDQVNVQLQSGDHALIIRNLFPQTGYVLVVKGRDKAGNEAISEPQRVTTATDTRPAQISNLKVEGSVMSASGNTQEAVAQLVVTWDTDEPTTTQVEFGEGTGSTYPNKTQQDTNLTVNHLVVISGLTPSKVYHLRAISKDSAGNEALSIDTVSITPKATDNALNLVINNLQQVFGFLGNL